MRELSADFLESTKEWQRVKEHVEGLIADYGEHLLSAKTMEDVTRLQGRVEMLRMFLTLPKELFKVDGKKV